VIKYKMPVSYHEHFFYSLCLRGGIPIIPVRQDYKQDIKGFGTKIKNFDFICHYKNKIYLIDVKGFSRLFGDTKVTSNDIDSLLTLEKLYGKNAIALFVYVWMDRKCSLDKDVFNQKFRIKAIEVTNFKKISKKQKGWGDIFYRIDPRFKDKLKDIWDYFPQFKEII